MPGLETEDEREQEARKIVQITVSQERPDVEGMLYGLDNHGDVWEFSTSQRAVTSAESSSQWQKLPPLPES